MPDGFATTADAYRRFLAHEGLADRVNALLADLDVDDARRLAEVGKEIRDAVESQPFPADLEQRHPVRLRRARRGRRHGRRELGRPLERHGGGPARRVLRRAAGDLPQRQWHRQHPARHQARLRVPLQRPRHRLPRPQQLRPLGRRALRGRPADGPLRPRRVRSHVHHRHRVRLSATPSSSPVPTASARQSCRARSTRTSSTSTSRPSRAGPSGDPQARRGRQGDEDGLHAETRPWAARRSSSPVDAADQRRFSLTDDEVTELARHAAQDRGALRPPDGHRVGQATASTASSTSCRPAQRR